MRGSTRGPKLDSKVTTPPVPALRKWRLLKSTILRLNARVPSCRLWAKRIQRNKG